MANQTVKSRLVINFPGFEKTGLEHQLERLNYCAIETGKVWGFEVERQKDEHALDHHSVAEFETTAPNWKTKTRLIQFTWSDIVDAYEDAPFPKGLFENMPKFLAFFADGTVGKYFKASKRYWGFTIFPILLIAIFAIISWFFSGWQLAMAGMGNIFFQVIAMLVLTLVLCKWPGERLYLIMTVADWGFARDMVNRSNPEIEKRYEAFADVTAEEIKKSDAQEIILVGHSFGALWAIAALSIALERDRDLLKGKRVVFLALGSSILKIALAPAAEFMRKHWGRAMEEKGLFWHEVQTKDDLIAFYKCDPFEALGLENMKADYAISRIRFKAGMKKARYKKMRRSFFRTHRQYILNYDNRVRFDYLLRLFGPFSAKELVRNDDLHKSIDENGALV